MMNSENITYDGKELVRLMEAQLDRLNSIRYDSRYKELLGERIINKLNKWDDAIRRQKDEPLTIVVCGEFKRGKSSLINAILGEDVVTTAITTETITINKVCYGEHSNEIVLSGGKRIKLKDEELKSDKLRNILQSTAGATQLILKRPNDFLKKVTIIDTPGLGDSLKDFSDYVEKALQMADAVIYVFSVSYPLSTQEQYFIRSCILPQKYTDLILVGNYSDVIESEEEFNNVQEMLTKRISDILPDVSPVFVSALDERNRQLGLERTETAIHPILENSFNALREKLNVLLNDKADFVIPDRIQRLISAMQLDVGKEMEVIIQGLETDSEHIDETVKNKEKEYNEQREKQAEIVRLIDTKCENHRSESVCWIEDLLNRMKNDASSLDSKVSADDIKRYYTLFCVDTLKEAFDKCTDYFLSTLYNELENIDPILTQAVSLESASISPEVVFEINNNTTTKGDRVAIIGEITDSFLTGGMISLITNYIGGTMREKEIEKNTSDYLSSAKGQLINLQHTVLPALSKSYDKISDSVKQQITAYFDNEQRTTENEITQVRSIAEKDESIKKEIRKAVEYLRGIFAEIQDNMNVI